MADSCCDFIVDIFKMTNKEKIFRFIRQGGRIKDYLLEGSLLCPLKEKPEEGTISCFNCEFFKSGSLFGLGAHTILCSARGWAAVKKIIIEEYPLILYCCN